MRASTLQAYGPSGWALVRADHGHAGVELRCSIGVPPTPLLAWGGSSATPRASDSVVAASLGSTFALVPAALLTVAAFLVRRAGARERLLQVGRIVVPVGLAAIAIIAGIGLVAESSRILR